MTRYKLCQVLAKREGYGVPGAIPTVRNNPIDLKHSPHSSHVGIGPNDIGIIDNIEDGWADADRQVELWASRGESLATMVLTITGWTPTTGDIEGNNSLSYLAFVCSEMGMDASALVSDALKIPADPAFSS